MAIDITPTTILAPFEAEHQAVNLTRNSGGSAIAPNQTLKDYGNDQWRYNYNRDTGAFGRYVEDQATRLNTQFSAPSSDEDVTVDNVEHTISFWGGGTVTLSGAHSETINGTDSVTRTEVQFTPTAGTLTISPSGDIEFLQLEEGSSATSPIAGDGQMKTRDPDIATVTDLDAINFNPSEFTFVIEYMKPSVSERGVLYNIYPDGVNAGDRLRIDAGGDLSYRNGNGDFEDISGVVNAGQTHKTAIAASSSDVAIAHDGQILHEASNWSNDFSTYDKITLGHYGALNDQWFDGYLRSKYNYPRFLDNSDLIQETTI